MFVQGLLLILLGDAMIAICAAFAETRKNAKPKPFRVFLSLLGDRLLRALIWGTPGWVAVAALAILVVLFWPYVVAFTLVLVLLSSMGRPRTYLTEFGGELCLVSMSAAAGRKLAQEAARGRSVAIPV